MLLADFGVFSDAVLQLQLSTVSKRSTTILYVNKNIAGTVALSENRLVDVLVCHSGQRRLGAIKTVTSRKQLGRPSRSQD